MSDLTCITSLILAGPALRQNWNQTETETATIPQPKMAKLNDVFPSAYLKADDIPEEGMVVTISKVEIKELGQGKDKQTKPVITLEETDKEFVCNKTNCNTLAKLLGSDDTDDWAGHQIRLIAMEVQFGADLVNSIRVSTKPVKAKTAAKKTAPVADPDKDVADDDVPF